MDVALIDKARRMSYQLKQIGGIPYFVKDRIVHTFEIEDGRPSKHCIPIGTYDEATQYNTTQQDLIGGVQNGSSKWTFCRYLQEKPHILTVSGGALS